MAFDFPTSPALDELYTTDGRTWVWNGRGWKQVDTSGILLPITKVAGSSGSLISTPPSLYVREAVVYNPSFANVESLLHFNGADEGTTFTDENGRTWTPAGTTAVTDTDQKVFGTAAGRFGSGGRISTPDEAGLDLAGNDFCIELRYRSSNNGVGQDIFAKKASSGYAPIRLQNYYGTLYLHASSTGTSYDVAYYATVSALAVNTWYWIIINRNAGIIRAWINGSLAYTGAVTTALFSNSDAFCIGANGDGSNPVEGWVDEFRLTNGDYVYPTQNSFDIPVEEYPNS